MPKIELISKDESFEIGDGECTFGVRRLHPDVLRDLRRQNTVDGRVDTDGLEKDILDYVLQYWRGEILLPDGTAAPCTREHKWVLPGGTKLQIMAAAHAANRQGELAGDLKNLNAPCGTADPKGESSQAA